MIRRRFTAKTNHFRYRPRHCHLIRFQTPDAAANLEDAALIALACKTTGTALMLSAAELSDGLKRFAKSVGAKLVIESEEELVLRLQNLKGGTLRIFGEYDPFKFSPAEIGNLPILAAKALANGRLELLNYLKEQSIFRNRAPLRQHFD